MLRGLWALALLISVSPGFGNEARRVDWKIFDTPHFHVVFHEDVRPQAELARDFLEQAYIKIRTDLGVGEIGIPITFILTGIPDESNGLSSPLGHQVIIYTRPAQVIGASEIAWMKRVLAHELTHEITFLGLRKPFWGIYSELYKLSHIPNWFLEGLAQYEAESWDAKRNTFFAHVLYNSALEEYPAMATYTKNDPLSGRLVYEQGHAFLRFLTRNQGPRFLPHLMRKITVYPIWTEIKFLLSPLTADYLPLESALLDLTGRPVDVLYEEFLDSARAGLPNPPRHPPINLAEGVQNFAAVFEMKTLGNGRYLFTGQKNWEVDDVSLYQKDASGVRQIGPEFLNPVFDLSPDKRYVAYVRSYFDLDRAPVEKLFVMDIESGASRFVSDGAAHPVFLSPDSLAFSHYAHGKQSLSICALGRSSAKEGDACRDIASDSLVGFYGLSKSKRGLLFNGTDTAGRTGIYEFGFTRADSGFKKLIGDSARAEYPVEAADGSLRVIRDRGGLMQIDAWDRGSHLLTPVATYPLGTLYLHRTDDSTLATLAQTGAPGQWALRPTALPVYPGPLTDSPPKIIPSDSALVYQAPGFLASAPPVFPTTVGDAKLKVERPYHSLLETRPLIAYPLVFQNFPALGLGAGMILQDPLQLHSFQAGLGYKFASDEPGFNLDYVNGQLPFQTLWSVSNRRENVSDLDSIPGWKYIDMVSRNLDLTVAANFPAPWDLPVANLLTLELRNTYTFKTTQLATMKTNQTLESLSNAWILNRQEDEAAAYLNYVYYPAYAYSAVHPLQETELSIGWTELYPHRNEYMNWFARQTLPLENALTYTFVYGGLAMQAEPEFYQTTLPDGNAFGFYGGNRTEYLHFIYNAVDFPLATHFTWEIPVLGLWNYFGAGIFEKSKIDILPELDHIPPEIDHWWSRRVTIDGSIGGKLVELFFPFRSIPLALSQSAEFNFEKGSVRYGFQIEMDGLTNVFSLRAAKGAPPDLAMDPEMAKFHPH